MLKKEKRNNNDNKNNSNCILKSNQLPYNKTLNNSIGKYYIYFTDEETLWYIQ